MVLSIDPGPSADGAVAAVVMVRTGRGIGVSVLRVGKGVAE